MPGKNNKNCGQGALHSNVIRHLERWRRRGYGDGIPEQAPDLLEEKGRVPSYRQIVRAILRNDTGLSSLGYGVPKSAAYMAIKRIEIEARCQR